jgi:DNA repair exonuclease SbcCD ATPase subunit
MKIELLELIINNFKGVKSQTLTPGKETNVYGANETGKTTLYDAFLWLLFDKDSTDRSKFAIKNTVDTSLNRADHEVSAKLLVDGRSLNLKKVYREVWEKKRGSETEAFTRNEAQYYWNDVPCNMGDFQSRLAELIKEEVFKLITSTKYFNEVLTWTRRRDALLKLAGDITNEMVIDTISDKSTRASFAELIKLLNENKTIEDIKKEYASKKRNIKDTLEHIPARIDELKRSIPEKQDFSVITANLKKKEAELIGIDELILNASKALNEKQTEQRGIQQNIFSLQRQLDNIKNTLQTDILQSDKTGVQDIETTNATIKRLNYSLTSVINDINTVNANITKYNDLRETLRGVFYKINERELVYKEGEFACSTCHRPLETTDIDEKKLEMEKAFNSKNVSDKEKVSEEGKGYAAKVVEYEAQLAEYNESKADILSQLEKEEAALAILKENYTAPRPVEERLQDAVTGNIKYSEISTQIATLQQQIKEVPEVNNQELLDKKKSVTTEVDELKKQLSTKDQIDAAEKRIKELQEQEKNLSQELAQLEKTEFAAEQFTKGKMDLMELRIADKFKYVKFKLFDRQVNGGVVECCESMYKGVPYPELNTAAKVQAGLDIIDTLSHHYNISAPIFIDCRESVTWIPDTDSQIINLIVSPEDKTIRVKTVGVMDTLFA